MMTNIYYISHHLFVAVLYKAAHTCQRHVICARNGDITQFYCASSLTPLWGLCSLLSVSKVVNVTSA